MAYLFFSPYLPQELIMLEYGIFDGLVLVEDGLYDFGFAMILLAELEGELAIPLTIGLVL